MDCSTSRPWSRCTSATSLPSACTGLVEDLVEHGYELPSVYLLVGQRLRCQAARGYFQVVDGFAAGTGVVGRVIETGTAAHLTDVTSDPAFIAAVPGLRSEIAVPVVVGQAVVGVVNVESRQVLTADDLGTVEDAAAELGACLQALGGLPRPSLAQRLAHLSLAMTTALTPADITALALEAASSLSGMPGSGIAFLDGRLQPLVAHGRLAGSILTWGHAEVDVIRSSVANGMSSYFPGGEEVPATYAFLRATGVRAISAHPMVRVGELVGVLVLVSDQAVPHAPRVVEALEMLATQTAASLGVAELVAELSHRADVDDLTGLGNTAVFSADLRARAAAAGHHDSLVFIDVDDFKAVNDGYGHLAGDRLLQVLASEMQEVLREDDRLYRVGGDEFAALVSSSSRAETGHVVQRLLDAARRVRTTVSIGTARIAGHPPDHARRLADERLYLAKAGGRDRAEVG